MIKEEGVGVRQAGHDTPLGLLPGLAGVLHGEGAQEVDHHLASLLAPATGQQDLVQEPVQPLVLLRVQRRLTLLEHVPGRGLVRVDCAQLASLANQANQAASPDLPNYVI